MRTTDISTMDAVAACAPEEPDSLSNQVFGFWLYIMSDLVLFGTLFATYAVLGHHYAGGPTGRDLFRLPPVFAETMLLLFSTAAYGLSSLAAHRSRRKLVLAWLAVTFLCGLGFVAMEIREFGGLLLAGHGPQRSAFLSAFFALVGTHGTHVTFGLVWIAVMLGQVAAKGLTRPVRSRLVRLGIFWHFLDVVWVGVFSVVYLMGVMP